MLTQKPKHSAYAFVTKTGQPAFVAAIKEFATENNFYFTAQPEQESPTYNLEGKVAKIAILQFYPDSSDPSLSGSIVFSIGLYPVNDSPQLASDAKSIWDSFSEKMKNLSLVESWRDDSEG